MTRSRAPADRPAQGLVPNFSLYGEAPVAETRHFIHVERLSVRSVPVNWTIRPHAHRTLAQLFSIGRGSGDISVDGVRRRIASPALLIIPPATIHSFIWAEDTAGAVLTVSADLLEALSLRRPELSRVFERPLVCAFARTGDQRRLDMLMRQLAYELAWKEAGQGAAIDSLLTMIVVLALRVIGNDPDAVSPDGYDAHLVAQFRGLVERHFRVRPALSAYANWLGLSERRLRTACARIAHRTPLQMVQDRIMLEARRLLIASNRPASEIAEMLGFEDPAYFSRVFRASTGLNAREFRRGRDHARSDEGGSL